MAKVSGRPLPIPGFQSPRLPEEVEVNAPQLNGGMISTVDRADVPDNAWTLLRNARTRDDKTTRRFGTIIYAGTKPDANPVRKVAVFKPSPDSIYVFRITDVGVHYTPGTGWTPISGALVGGIKNKVDVATILGTFIIANGYNKLQKINLLTEALEDLGPNAPRAKYVTSNAERVVAANGGDLGEPLATVYWSGNRNISVFDAAEDISSGQQSLIGSSDDSIDPISGIFGFTTVMIIPRYESIWLATRNLGSASNPFNFYPGSPTVGCEIPGSIAKTLDGIIFVSKKHGSIFKFKPGGAIQNIGQAIYKDLLDDVDDPMTVLATYDKEELEYHLMIPGSHKVWVYGEKNGKWEQDDLPVSSTPTSIDAAALISDYTSFDELVGTFDGLTGTFDELSETPVVDTAMIYGNDIGELNRESSSRSVDQVSEDQDIAYTFEAKTKEFRLPRNDLIFTYLRYEYNAQTVGTITLQYSKDGGVTWTTARAYTTIFSPTKTEVIKFKKVIRARRLMWRLTATDGIFDLLDFEARFHVGGESA